MYMEDTSMLDANENSRVLKSKFEAVNAASNLLILCDSSAFSPFIPFKAFCSALKAGNIAGAQEECFNFTAALLNCPARRVSGNILLDYVLDLILIREHPFAQAAARGCADEALFSAVKNDLVSLQTFASLTEKLLSEFINTRAIETQRRNGAPDSYERLANAAWGGNSSVSARTFEPHSNAVLTPFELPSVWNYGEFELRDSFFADSELEEMYKRLLKSSDWSRLADELWNFFSVYGCGRCLKYRNFEFDGRELMPLPDLRACDFIPFAEDEYRCLLNNTIAFMRDESAKPMLLYGAEGMGKTTMMLELTDELPRLRLIYVTGGRENLSKLLAGLKNQPLKFMVLVDDLKAGELRGICEPLIPTNVLLAACSNEKLLESLFEVSVNLPNPQLNETVQLVSKLLKYQDADVPYEMIRTACVDYQLDAKSEFNMISVIRIAEMLLS